MKSRLRKMDAAVERDGGLNAFDDEFVERPAHLGKGLGAVGAVDDQFADE
jgi:hypothetical protein